MSYKFALIFGSLCCLLFGEVSSIEIIKSEKMADGHELTKLKFDGHYYIYFHPVTDPSVNPKAVNLISFDTFMHDPSCPCHYSESKQRKRNLK